MKKVLIVGASSYIGESFDAYVRGRFDVTTVGTLNDEWRKIDFSDFDSVLHVAGIAHRRQKAESADLYFKINRDLPAAVAEKSKKEGVKQFVFLSSLYAYGIKSGAINKDTVSKPLAGDYYSLSKYQAEKLIEPLKCDNFLIAIIRPPMVYGPNCKGNFPQLVKAAKLLPIYPDIENKRSMIYIDNLTELIALVIENNTSGVLCPQNAEYTNTVKVLLKVAGTLGKRRRLSVLLNPLVYALMPAISPLNSAFGNLYYDSDIIIMPFSEEYQKVSLEDSIGLSVDINQK